MRDTDNTISSLIFTGVNGVSERGGGGEWCGEKGREERREGDRAMETGANPTTQKSSIFR